MAGFNPVRAGTDVAITAVSVRIPIAGPFLRLYRDLFLGDAKVAERRGQIGREVAMFGHQTSRAMGAALANVNAGLVDFGRSIRIEAPGLNALRRDLGAVGPGFERELSAVIKDVVAIVARESATLAPRRSGKLAASIRPQVRGTRGTVGSRLPYAGVHEYGGTIRPRGAPIEIPRAAFVGRALDRREDAVIAELGKGIDRVFARHGFH